MHIDESFGMDRAWVQEFMQEQKKMRRAKSDCRDRRILLALPFNKNLSGLK